MLSLAVFALTLAASPSCTGTPQAKPGDTYETAQASTARAGGDVDNFIARRYPGCRILDHDHDNGYLEVKIRHDGREKTALFDGRRRWVRTLWETRRERLPKRVVAGMRAKGFAYKDIDDNDNYVVDTADGLLYAVQARRWNDDFIFLVTPGGTVMSYFTSDAWDDGRLRDLGSGAGFSPGPRHGDRQEADRPPRHRDGKWSDRHDRRRNTPRGQDDGEDHFDEGDDEWDDDPNP